MFLACGSLTIDVHLIEVLGWILTRVLFNTLMSYLFLAIFLSVNDVCNSSHKYWWRFGNFVISFMYWFVWVLHILSKVSKLILQWYLRTEPVSFFLYVSLDSRLSRSLFLLDVISFQPSVVSCLSVVLFSLLWFTCIFSGELGFTLLKEKVL